MCAEDEKQEHQKQKLRQNLFMQFERPMPMINPSLRPTSNTVGWAFGVLIDGIPFASELWHDDTDRCLTILLPYQEKLFDEVENLLPDMETSNIIGFQGHRECVEYTVMTDGMVMINECLDDTSMMAHVKYLKDMGLIRFVNHVENGSACIYSDYADNPVICVRISLTMGGTKTAYTPLLFKPSIGFRHLWIVENSAEQNGTQDNKYDEISHNKFLDKEDGEIVTNSDVITINHLNYPNKKGQVYCRAHNAVMKLWTMDCFGCTMCYGSIQGEGVECIYDDIVAETVPILAVTVTDPERQLKWITQLIDIGAISADPLCNKLENTTDAAIKHYVEIDDDEESAFGAAVFRDIFGMSIDEILDEEDDDTDPEVAQ